MYLKIAPNLFLRKSSIETIHFSFEYDNELRDILCLGKKLYYAINRIIFRRF
jgi:hypothetical protein